MVRVGLGRITPINARAFIPAGFQLDFADLGAGQVSLVPSAPNGITATFTRATAAWTKLSTGLWASVASGTPRSFYAGMDTTVGPFLGYLAEGARTNECLQSRAGTATHWISTNMTPAQNQIGIDGAANSCFSITGSAANGTFLQPIASTFTAAISRTFSCFVKRITGTGAVALTVDGGATYTTVTPSINGTTFTQVQATGSVATATVGIKLVTSGDAVAVDMAMQEQATFASTPIPTGAAAVPRNGDVLIYSTGGWFNANAGTMFSQFVPYGDFGAVARIFCIDDGSLNNRFHQYVNTAGPGAANLIVVTGGVTQADFNAAGMTTRAVSQKFAATYTVNDFADSLNAGAMGTDTAGSLPTGITNARVGVSSAGTDQLYGAIRRIAYYPVRLANSVLQQITA